MSSIYNLSNNPDRHCASPQPTAEHIHQVLPRPVAAGCHTDTGTKMDQRKSSAQRKERKVSQMKVKVKLSAVRLSVLSRPAFGAH